MSTIQVDGLTYAADPADNLLHACLSHGLDLPYFCWHPALGSVGACRQCAVKQFHDEHDTQGKLVMACMTAASAGTRIAIRDPEAVEFRASVIEWLMTNHPHDCPVCQEGGECHLQDMTVMTGHIYRRYRFRKRTHRNQYLGPFITHEMNRCIACYRCTRFYREYAGGHDLAVLGSHNHIYFGRHADGVLESEFSGNLVEVCPTGVFTDKTLSAVYTRKWDLQSAPSVCVHCALGCNTFANGRYGQMRRVINRYHHEINGYFLCDRGRFGHGFVSAPTRLRQALHAPGAPGAPGGFREQQTIGREAALAQFDAILSEHTGTGAAVIGIGSPRASVEANFALRALVGPEHFHVGYSDEQGVLLGTVLQLLRHSGVPVATLQEVEGADAALVLGEDVSDSAPRLALALRQMSRHATFALAAALKIPTWQDAAVRNLGRDARAALFILSADATRLDDVATPLRASPPDIERLGAAVLHALDPAAPAVAGLSEPLQAHAGQIAGALRAARRPLIVAGVAAGSEALLRLGAAIADALARAGGAARLVLTVPECNSVGLALLGGAPLSAALQALRSGQAATVLVLENDLYRRAARDSVDAALDHAHHVVVLDHSPHATSRRADLVLPVATFVESSGTLINYEARAQRFFQLLFAGDQIMASWRWLNAAACARDAAAPRWGDLDQVLAAIAAELPALAATRAAAPGANMRIVDSRIASAPHRESGRTAMYAAHSVHEPPPPPNPDAPYTESMEGYYGPMPAALYPYFWTPAWNSEQGLNKFQQEVGGPLRGGPAGVRLIDPQHAATMPATLPVPPAFASRAQQWLLIPREQVFGSEELSALAPAVAERIAAPTIGLNPQDAALLGVAAGDMVEIQLEDTAQQDSAQPASPQRLAAQIRPSLACGVAALTVGLPGQPWVSLPAWGTLARART